MFLYSCFEVPRGLTDIAFVTKAIKFLYYTNFILFGIGSFNCTFIKGFDKNIILGLIWIKVYFVNSFTLTSNLCDAFPMLGSFRTAGNFSGPNTLDLFRLLWCDFTTLLIKYSGYRFSIKMSFIFLLLNQVVLWNRSCKLSGIVFLLGLPSTSYYKKISNVSIA